MDTTTATPAEIDTEIYRLHVERERLSLRLIALRRMLGQAENKAAGYGVDYHGASVDEIGRQLGITQEELSANVHALEPLGKEWIRRGGWTRWFLVPDGHLHYDTSSDRCSRIPTTEHYWMTEYSGRSADEMIELAGDRVCTTCFPDAPVAPRPATARFMTPSEAERAAYTEAAKAKLDARKAAQITTPDGAELRTANGDLIKTEVAARRRALADASDIAFYGDGHPDAAEWRETVRRMIEAIAHRDAEHFGDTGVTIDGLRDEINNKVAKKAKREQWMVRAQV